MAKISREELLQTKVGGRTLEEWDQGWEAVPDAYLKKQPHLRHSVGLFRTLLNGEIMYISRATEASGGIEKGLQRIRGKKTNRQQQLRRKDDPQVTRSGGGRNFTC